MWVKTSIDDFRRGHTAVFSVTWKIFMGVPPGAIEKDLMRCCSIGTLQTFWRFGVLVQGCLGGGVAGKTFVLLVEYSQKKKTVDMKVYGSIGTAAPWAALSFGVSAVRTMCLDFPGLRWRASLKCPQHNQDMRISNEVSLPVCQRTSQEPVMNASNNAAEAPEKSATRRCRASETALVDNCGLFSDVGDAWVLVALLIYHHPLGNPTRGQAHCWKDLQPMHA